MTSPQQKPPDPYIGRSVLNGQFLIEQKIGSGGMGAVYRASQPALNRQVAVKILHPKLTNRKDLASRFRREARAMSHLTHENTVKVFLYGELEDGSLYIVMEFLDGKNLNQIVRKEGPLPYERAIPILMQVCGALHEAHNLGIIHRDLKPENIFLTNKDNRRDFAKVLDFGLAKVTERELRPGSIMLTQEGMVFGTPEFMSPEQAQGKKLDARSDIYSLATILYEVLTGKLPYDAKTPMEYIQLHVTKPPIPLDDRVPGKRFPPGLSDVIMKALKKKPDERYATAQEFAESLGRFAGNAVNMRELFPRTVEPTHVDAPVSSAHNPQMMATAGVGPGGVAANPRPNGQGVPPSGGLAPSVDGSRTIRMAPNAPVSSPLPPHLRGVPGAVPGAHMAVQAPTKPRINYVTLSVVAVICLMLGIGLTIGIIYLVL
jgi:serine/threonine-protein kinase